MTNTTGQHQPTFENILFATDFSEASQAAFRAALRLSLSFGARLYILNVFEYVNISPPESGGILIDLHGFYQDAEVCLDKLVKEALSNGVRATGTVAKGTSHTSILEHVASKSIDLVVIGTRAIHGFDRLIFGSTAEAVLRKASCPVFTVGPQAAQQVFQMGSQEGNVLFATDFHVTTKDALRYAAAFASKMHLPLHCLNVLPRGADAGTHKGVIPGIVKEALQHLVLTLNGTPAPPICAAVAYGSEISTAVVEYARGHDVKLIVLGVRRASLAASHIPAHIAYRIITEAPCPVLTMAFPSEPKIGKTIVLEHSSTGQPALV